MNENLNSVMSTTQPEENEVQTITVQPPSDISSDASVVSDGTVMSTGAEQPSAPALDLSSQPKETEQTQTLVFNPDTEELRQTEDMSDYELLNVGGVMAQEARGRLDRAIYENLKLGNDKLNRITIAGEMAARAVSTKKGLSLEEKQSQLSALTKIFYDNEETRKLAEGLMDANKKYSQTQQMKILHRWLENSENLAAVKDDLDKMNFLEALYRKVRNASVSVGQDIVGGAEALSKEAVTKAASFEKNLYAANFGILPDGVANEDIYDTATPSTDAVFDENGEDVTAFAAQVATPPESAKEKNEPEKPKELIDFEKKVDDELKEKRKAIDDVFKPIVNIDFFKQKWVPEYYGTIGNFVLNSAGAVSNLATQMVTTAALSMIPGVGKPIAWSNMWYRILGGDYVRGMEKGVSHERAYDAGFWDATVQWPMEAFQLHSMFKGIRGVTSWSRLSKWFLGEGFTQWGTETIQGFPERFAELHLSNSETVWENTKWFMDPKNFGKTLYDSSVENLTMFPATLIIGGFGAAWNNNSEVRKAWQEGREAEALSGFVEKASEVVKGTRAVQQGDKVASAVDYMTDQNGFNQVTISAERLNEIYGERAAEIAKKLGYDGNFNEALQNQASVPVSIGKVIQSNALDSSKEGLELGREVVRNIRFTPEGLTAKEATEKAQVLVEQSKENQKKIAEEYKDNQDFIDTIKMYSEKFANETLKPAMVDSQARLWAARTVTVAKALGMSLTQTASLMNQYLKVEYKTDSSTAAEAEKTATETVQTPAFKEWFGESKVASEDGTPIVVYHGTQTGGFDTFRSDRNIMATSNRDMAAYYTHGESTEDITQKQDERSGVYPMYMKLANPFIVDAQGKTFGRIAVPEIRKEGLVSTDEIGDWAKANGYDGAIIKNVVDGYSEGKGSLKGDVYIAFKPDQVKSTYNNGKFSTDTGNIFNQLNQDEVKTDGEESRQVTPSLTMDADSICSQIEKIKHVSESISVSGLEFDRGSSISETIKNATKYGLSLRYVTDDGGKKVNRKFVNKDTGQEVRLTRNSIGELFHHERSSLEHILSVSAIPEIIEKGIYIKSEINPDPNKHPENERYDYYLYGVNIEGVDYTVKAIFAKDSIGMKYYDHSLSRIKINELFSTRPLISSQGFENSSFIRGYDKRLLSILQDVIKYSNLNNKASGEDIPFKQSTLGQTVLNGSFLNGGSAVISLFKNHNASTFYHESAHVWLQMMRDMAKLDVNTIPDANRSAFEQNKSDFNYLVQWAGMTEEDLSNSEKLTELQEKVARHFEGYLREGIAPTSELKGVFGRIKGWLVKVYRTTRDLSLQSGMDIEISPEVRGVFDRWMATQEQIEYAAKESQVEAELEALGKAAVDDVSFDDLLKKSRTKIEKTQEQVEAEVSAKVEKRVERAQTAWKKEAKKAERDVKNDIKEMPVYQVRESIAEKGGKLDLAAVTAIAPEAVSSLEGMLAENGRNPSQVAMEYGYDSAAEMIQDLATAPALDDAIKQGVQAVHDEYVTEKAELSSEEIRDLVDDAMHSVGNVETALVLREVLARLSASSNAEERKGIIKILTEQSEGLKTDAEKKAEREAKKNAPKARTNNIQRVMAQQLIEKAKDVLLTQSMKSISPKLFMRAESAAAAKVRDALLKGKMDQAYEALDKQIRAHAMTRAAYDLREVLKGGVTFLRKVVKLGKGGKSAVDAEALDQARQILGRVGLYRGNLANTNHIPLSQWARTMEEAGESIVISDWIIDGAIPPSLANNAPRGRAMRVTDLTAGEFVDVIEAVQNIIHLGRGMRQAMTDARGRSLDEISERVQDSIAKIYGYGTELDYDTEKATEMREGGFGQWWNKFMSEHRKVEFILRRADGFKDTGEAWKAIFRPLYNAQNAELEMQEVSRNVMQGLFEKLKGYKLDERMMVPGMSTTMSLEQRLMVALNSGTETNYARLLNTFSADQVQNILNTLDENQWNFVQGVWDHVNSFWGQIERLEMEVSGVKPQKVNATPVKTKYGIFEGGYFPIVYDSNFNIKTQERDNLKDNNISLVPHTAHDFTKKRMKEVSDRALDLRLNSLQTHLDSVIHDLTHRKAVRDVSRLLNDKGLQGALIHASGRESFNQLIPWLRAVAGNTAGPGSAPAASGFLSHVRSGATMAALGYNVFSGIKQHLSIFQAASRIGAKNTSIAYGRMLALIMSSTCRDSYRTQAYDLSTELRNRSFSFDREVSDLISQKKGKMSQKVLDSFGAIMKYFDEQTCLAIWSVAYDSELDKGHNVQQAVEYADSVIRQTQPSSFIKDKVSLMRDKNGVVKLFTMFYTAFSNTFNLLDESVHMSRNGNVSQACAQVFCAAILPAIAGCLIDGAFRGKAPDDPDDLAQWVAWNMLTYPLQSVVYLRDFANIARTSFTSERYGQSVQLSPIQGAWDTFARITAAMSKNLKRGKSLATRQMYRDMSNLILGYGLQMPSGAINKAVLGVADIASGQKEFNVSSVLDLVR